MKLSLVAVIFVALSAASVAETEPSRDFLYGNFYYHFEQRSGVSESHPEISLGYDRLIGVEGGWYAGPRLGLVWEQVLTFTTTTNTKFFVGGHVYRLFSLGESVGIKAGFAADILVGDSSNPLYLYTGIESGLRFQLGGGVYAEIPFELGIYPFFSGVPVFEKFGAQIGFGL
jgi:hypothetical protein